jgi:hypothetical protein
VIRSVHSIFCDDIRQEVGNKLSYMGIYTGQMFVPALPLTLPKLCVVMHAITLATNPFKQIKFRLLKNDELIAEADVNASDAPLPQTPLLPWPGDDLKMMVQQVFQIYPFLLAEPCVLRARAIAEDDVELKGGSLIIAVAPPPEALTPIPEVPRIGAAEQILDRFSPYLGLTKKSD